MDDVDPSDFLASPSPRSRAADSGGFPILRWGLVLLAVGFIPLGFSLLRSQGPSGNPPKSYTQALQEEEGAAKANPSLADDLTIADDEDFASEPVTDPSAHAKSPPALASQESPEGPAKAVAKEPSSTPAPAAATKSNSVRYQVQSGDTLSEIAQRFGVRSGDIASANGIRGQDHILVGQYLTIPDVPGEKALSVASTPPAKPKSGGTSGATVASTAGSAKPNPKPASPQPSAVSPPTPAKTVVLGPPAPRPPGITPYPAGGLPAPSAQPGSISSYASASSTAASGPHQVVLGPPANPLLPTSGLPSGTGKEYPGQISALSAKRFSDPRYRVPPTQLQEAINAAALEPIPNQSTASMAAAINRSPATDESFKAGVMSYLVQPFDTLASIAKAHGTTQEVILQLNGNGSLLEGQTILLPISQSRLASPSIRSLDERMP